MFVEQIAAVYIWQNNMVMVFDEQGEQIVAFQGSCHDVAQRILDAASPATRWYDAIVHGGCIEVDRVTWQKRAGLTSAT